MGVTNIDKKYISIPKVYRVLLTIHSKIFPNNKTINKNNLKQSCHNQTGQEQAQI